MFNISTANYQLKGESSSIGLDAFISSERIIWLDCQPLLSAAVAERELSSIYSKYHNKLLSSILFKHFCYVSQRHVQGITLKNGNFVVHWDYGRGPIPPVAFLLILHLPCSPCCSRLFSWSKSNKVHCGSEMPVYINYNKILIFILGYCKLLKCWNLIFHQMILTLTTCLTW